MFWTIWILMISVVHHTLHTSDHLNTHHSHLSLATLAYCAILSCNLHSQYNHTKMFWFRLSFTGTAGGLAKIEQSYKKAPIE